MADTTLARVSRKEQINLMREDLDELAATLDPLTCVAAFPAIFVNIFALITAALLAASGVNRFAVCLPRGHGKTIVMKFMLYWAIMFSSKRFIVVICNTESLAENLIGDVWNFLWSDNSRALFGDLEVEIDRVNMKKFYFRGRLIILKAQGSGTAVRGLNIDNRRPDLFLCDDMQDADNAKSETQAVDLQKWFLGTLLKAGAPEGYTVIYLGNMYPDIKIKGSVERYTCILRNLQINRLWTTWVVGAILEDGQALWPEVRSLESLFEELEQDMSMGEEATFYAEVLNDPKGKSNALWDPAKVADPHNELFTDEQALFRFMILDPSTGKKKSDDQVVLLVECWDEKPVVTDLRVVQLSAPKTVHFIVGWMIETRCPLLCAESVAYQSTIIEWFDYICKDYQVEGLTAVPISPKGRTKNSRIVSAFKAVMGGSISLSYNVRPYLFHQARQFDITKIDNADDGWDCVAYVEEAFNEYSDLALVQLEATRVPGVDNVWEVVEQGGGIFDFNNGGIDFNG